MDDISSDLREYLRDTLYESPNISTPFRKSIKIVFADDTASGRPSKSIDTKIQTNIIPYYSNTHSNAHCGIMMKNLIQETRDIVRKTFHLTSEHKIIFTGNGATGAINHLANSINFKKYKNVHIFISTYEHYSNHLPWVEISKEQSNVHIDIIPIVNDDIDFDWLDARLANVNSCDDLNIVSITACSNVTGVITDLQKLIQIIKKYNNDNNHPDKHTYLFCDCACIAPYKLINCEHIDAIFVSMHKFVGGTSTPGLLIAKRELFVKGHPYNPGGGCVKKADSHNIEYEDDIEKKETGGTPNICGIIRVKYILESRNKFINEIEHREAAILNYVHSKLKELSDKYSKLKVIMLSKFLDRRLPIISLSIDDMHYNYVVALFNDLFGIQTRGGISCCGMLGEYVKDTCKMNGWCRITFNWMMDKEIVDFILNALESILKFGHSFKSMYAHDKKANLFNYTGSDVYDIPHNFLIKY